MKKAQWIGYFAIIFFMATGFNRRLSTPAGIRSDTLPAVPGVGIPEEDRFTKTPLAIGEFYEPTEITILPDFDILVAQRRGEILMYKNSTKKVKQAGYLDVYCKTKHTPGVNAEEGVLGIQADPDFSTNHFVYIYYSPSDTSVDRLSRFTFTHDSIDLKSEKIILQLYSQREICCHTGGPPDLRPGKTPFLSPPDNFTPFFQKKKPHAHHRDTPPPAPPPPPHSVLSP